MNNPHTNWAPEQAVLPYADIENNIITIHDIRHSEYRSTTDFTLNYHTATHNLDELEKAWLVVEHFGSTGAAHVFLSYEFSNNRFLSISIEARRKVGQSFSTIKGLFGAFELIYVVANERDVIKLRANHRKDPVYVYPLKATKDHVQYVFLQMMYEMNALHDKPRRYNTITNNCITNITKHINAFSPNALPWHYTFLIPATIDRHVFNQGLIDTQETDLTKIREAALINARAEHYADDPDFSLKIRNQ
jgi:hypothetical protein